MAATITAASGQWFDVASAVALATTNDTVLVNDSGVYNWSNGVKVVVPMTIQFNGTIIADYNTNTADSGTASLLWLNTDGSTNLYRITGIGNMTNGNRATQLFDSGYIHVDGLSPNVRIDHCTFRQKQNIGVGWYGPWGVIDHNVFDPPSFTGDIKIGHANQFGATHGDGPWATNSLYGTALFLYIEDNAFTNHAGQGIGIDCQSGGRYVARYNIADGVLFGGHGSETTGRERGSRTKEVYENLFVMHSFDEAIHFRSGSGVVWSNDFWNVNSAVHLVNYRLGTGGTPWGFADGTNPYDSNDATLYDSGTATAGSGLGLLVDSTKSWTVGQWNSEYSIRDVTQNKASIVKTNSANNLTYSTSSVVASGTPITFAAGDTYQIRKVIKSIDQPGRGMGALMSNSTPVINGIAQWPNNEADPVWMWSNTFHSVTTQTLTRNGYYTEVEGVDFSNAVNTAYSPYVYPHPLVQAQDPSINTQPTSQTVFVGQTATFTVSASGTSPLTYQWKKNGSTISGATQSTYTTPATVSGDNGAAFLVNVTSGAGGPITSATATLTVNPDPNITAQPSNQTVTAPATATFSVTASGATSLGYQWKKNGSNISGATQSSYTTPSTTTGDSGSTFQCVVTDTAGSLNSSSATLTVNAAGGGGSPASGARTIVGTIAGGSTL